MATTIDHLSENLKVRVIQEFVDAQGTKLRVGDSGVITALSYDEMHRIIRIELRRVSGVVKLAFSGHVKTGPGNGRMRQFFEVEEAELAPAVTKALRPRTMIIPPPAKEPAMQNPWLRMALDPSQPDQIEALEAEVSKMITVNGSAASLAELYAERMRMFQRAGDETRAVAAFKRAVAWMGTYASWATSGGEGAAMSLERDQFRQALAREFGYDPLLHNSAPDNKPLQS